MVGVNSESILMWLGTIGVPAEVISVGTETDNAWCLLPDEQPDFDEAGGECTAWEVFWREQGNRYDWARFDSEQVACHYLFGRLAWAQVARGALTTVDPDDAAPRRISE